MTTLGYLVVTLLALIAIGYSFYLFGLPLWCFCPPGGVILAFSAWWYLIIETKVNDG
jgi:hypothetical protein